MATRWVDLIMPDKADDIFIELFEEGIEDMIKVVKKTIIPIHLPTRDNWFKIPAPFLF